ncbi:hypothetical protein TNCV_4599451 [Trichonephila clavipes]|nr:hypothetical protein TNCV_4599451 [Trichonephila clavipes]
MMCDSFVGCAMCLMAWLHLRWIDGTMTAAVLYARPGSPMKEVKNLGPFVLFDAYEADIKESVEGHREQLTTEELEKEKHKDKINILSYFVF